MDLSQLESTTEFAQNPLEEVVDVAQKMAKLRTAEQGEICGIGRIYAALGLENAQLLQLDIWFCRLQTHM